MWCERGVIKELWKLVQVTRQQIFGSDDDQIWMPAHQQQDASIMVPPFFGNNYRPGGILLLGINPGGGDYKNEHRNYGDSLVYPIAHAFTSCDASSADLVYINQFRPAFVTAKPTWPIYHQHLAPLLKAASIGLQEIAYFNFIPYRCRKNRYPVATRSPIIERCSRLIVNPLVSVLEPSLIVCVGKTVHDWFDLHLPNQNASLVFWDRTRAPRHEGHASKIEQNRRECLQKIANFTTGYLPYNC